MVKLGSISVIKKLLEAEANPNIRDRACGLTVLHDAVRDGFEDAVLLLLNYRADSNIADWKGNLPLHLAAETGPLNVVRLLLDATADIGARNNAGLTPAELALGRQRLDVYELIQAHVRNGELKRKKGIKHIRTYNPHGGL